jgi:hypothetical protein
MHPIGKLKNDASVIACAAACPKSAADRALELAC